MTSHLSNFPAGQGTLSKFSQAIVAAAFTICSYGQALAEVPNGLAPGTTVITMKCSAQQGHFISNSFIKGVESGPFIVEGRPPGPVNDAELRVYTSDQMPFTAQRALGGGPVLEYTLTLKTGEQVVWSIAEIYTKNIAEFPDYIFLTGSSGRFLKLTRFQDRHFWGGYTGADTLDDGLKQDLQYTPISCLVPISPNLP